MSNDNQRTFEFLEIRLEPERCLRVEMVGRLVEQEHIGVGEQQPRNRNTAALAAGEDGNLLIPGRAAKICHSALDEILQIPVIVTVDDLLQLLHLGRCLGVIKLATKILVARNHRLRVGDRVPVVVKSIDENRRIYVSQRELFGTWEENAARFRAGETVAGIVRSIEPYGVFVELAPNLAGLAELKDDVEVGDTAAVYIKSILPEKMKLKLVIIDTQSEAEKRKRPEYFIDVEKTRHLSYWRYSPMHCKKVIETYFDR